MRKWSRSAMFWNLALCLALIPGLFAQDCQVVFTLNPPLSNLTLSGAVTKPLTSPFTSVNPEILSGLQGEYVASLPAPCPTDAAGLQAALATAQLSTTPSTGLLEFYPSQITVKAGDLATIVFTDVAFNSTLQLAAASNQATLNLTIAQGYTNSTSIVTPDGAKIDLVGVTASNTTQAAITTEGSKVSITLTNVVMVLSSDYISYFAGQPLNGGADYILSGSIVMQTVVGCTESCGPNGRCAAAEDGTVGCQCECGWSGAGCSVPSGFCPRYADDGSTAAICPATPPPAPMPAPTPSVEGGQSSACGAAQCSSWQLWDATSGSCQCRNGFDGPGCDACKDNAACSTYFSTATGKEVSATCSTAREYSNSTIYKAYKCELDASTGLDGVEPGTFTVGCNTTTGTWSKGDGVPGSIPSVAEGSFCEVRSRNIVVQNLFL
jgi:plastocyanin